MMAGRTSVFDDLDDVTAQLAITLYLEDIAAIPSIAPPASPPSDDVVALRILEADLKAYRVIRGYDGPPLQAANEEPLRNIPAPVVRIAQVDCVACGDRFNAERCLEVPCLHYYCDGCLEGLYSAAMRDKTLYPPRCCRQEIPWDIARDLVSGELAAQFEAKKEELDDKSPVYCHDKHCSEYIKADGHDVTKAVCSTCQAITCTLCKQGTHDGACPQDEEVQKMREYAKEEGNQECAQCHQLVELSTGCNHITFVSSLLHCRLVLFQLTNFPSGAFASTNSATAVVSNGRTARASNGTKLALLREPPMLPIDLVWEALLLLQSLPPSFVGIMVAATTTNMATWRELSTEISVVRAAT